MRQPESRFVQANGIRMHYLDWGGDGRLCVMLHGNSMCGGVWEPIVQRVGHRLHCITPDLRNHGETDKPDVPITWDLLAKDMADFYRALEVRDAVLVGHSRGAGIGVFSTATCPERFAGAYLVEPSSLRRGTFYAEDFVRLREGRQGVQRKRSVFPSRQAMFDAYKGRGILRHVTDESLWALVNHGSRPRPDGTVELKCPPEAELAFFAPRIEPETLWSAVRRLSFPIVLLYSEGSGRGLNDPLVRQFVDLTHARFETVPGGHNTAMEHPDLHARLLLDFVDRIGRAGRTLPA